VWIGVVDPGCAAGGESVFVGFEQRPSKAPFQGGKHRNILAWHQQNGRPKCHCEPWHLRRFSGWDHSSAKQFLVDFRQLGPDLLFAIGGPSDSAGQQR